MYEKPRFQGLRINLLHFFICGRLIDTQGVEMKFRDEEAGVNRSFVPLRMTRTKTKNRNNV